MTTVLIVDDDPSIRRLLRRFLESESFVVHEAPSGNEAIRILDAQAIDLVTLDLNLKGEDGLELLRRLRRVSEAAVIMITGKGGLIDRVVGLEIGADDYITKPFELREVLARIRAVLRRHQPPQSSLGPSASGRSHHDEQRASSSVGDTATTGCYHFAHCTLDVPARELRDPQGAQVILTTTEFELLLLFLRRARRVLSRDCIMDALRGGDWHPSDRSIDNNVARLRRKLAVAGVDNAIRTIRGVGYQFVSDVQGG